MAETRIDSDLVVTGSFSASSMTLASGAVSNASVAAAAGIEVTKLRHLIMAGTDFGVAGDAAPAADTYKTVFVARGACTIRAVKATLRDCGTTADVKFDVYKATAGAAALASVLSATINFTQADADNTPKSGSLSTTTLAAGDMLVAFMDYTSATGVLGPYLWVEIDTPAS